MLLHNRINRKELEIQLMNEPFKRLTVSFYRYIHIQFPSETRDQLYLFWSSINCLGRIYIAHEGINAQMSIPEHNKDKFIEYLNDQPYLTNVPLKWAVEDDGKSFTKLTIKVRSKIVADGLQDGAFDTTNVGKHLTALEFHNAIDDPDVMVVDMRNHYETEIGRFKNAISPESDTFREGLQKVTEILKDEKDRKILLYCTGGIRCEKASAYLRHIGFSDVNQLYGGIIEYSQTIKKLNIESKFIGKNFVFDRRLGEDINGQVISRCHQCSNHANTHTNCANNDCHLLFIQCSECAKKHEGCCSDECQNIIHLSPEEQREIRQKRHIHYSESKIFKSRLNPDLMKSLKMMG